MAMSLPLPPVTADDLEAFPEDGNRYEIIDGELIVSATPSLLHQRTLREFVKPFLLYVDAIGVEILFAPFDVRASPTTQVEPDLLAFTRVPAAEWTTRWLPMSRLLLAVEILSPGTVRVDRGIKRQLFQSQRVPAYWIVDADARTVDVWRPDAVQAQTVTDQLVWQPVPESDPLVLDLPTLFRRAHAE